MQKNTLISEFVDKTVRASHGCVRELLKEIPENTP